MKNTVLLIIFTSFISACTSFPPPRIENGVYLNPEYEFSVSIPPGWVQTEKVPDWMKDPDTISFENKVKNMFFNNKSNGVIIIATDKTIFDLKKLSSEKIKEIFEKDIKQFVDRARKKPLIKDISYEVYSPSTLIIPSPVSFIEGRSESELFIFRLVSKGFLYNCQEDDTCYVVISLISLSNTYEQNKEVYENVLKSLKQFY